MRKLLVALALVPAFSQAALVIEGGPVPNAPQSASNNSNVPTVKAANASATGATDARGGAITAATASAASEPQGFVVAPLWEASPADQTFRQLFERWGAQAGWKTFWEVGQEIPVVASSPFYGTFTDAAQAVLDTTLSTDLPVHPCFYTNNVMRVLPTSTECNPK
ncbi:toxin co-regulated pilus biosynthesis Q family protein [Burkholderia multivorans]|uniref:toxin co-regulated pilus biosynthesis Q family protein n=1 Tax=Burkholderia multivorans TaxID=87883 RepID=UPI000691EC9A|nr:toxin co-regulated pilus biosynthesis Q family protein [Burkholderia multivorans]MDR9230014.1 hypothetical protein [Burkholderia multivorans]HDR9474379.1 toxin co-regulated pilus biosynthesis Q family protein [Burkholderia multivorans]HDR9480221.1 toxin co-regulated pilus biosynthesis Q family protein [Burkholderia multivorans]